MPVGSSAHAAAISRPRTAASATAASGVSTPAIAAAASSPTECPAVHRSDTGSSTRADSRLWASSAVATTRGWVTAVSLISSASAVVPRRSRSRPVASDQRASVARVGVVDEPRSEHAGGLRALTGREQGDHGASFTGATAGRHVGSRQIRPYEFGGLLQVCRRETTRAVRSTKESRGSVGEWPVISPIRRRRYRTVLGWT